MLINFIIELHYLSGFIKFLIRWNGFIIYNESNKKIIFSTDISKVEKIDEEEIP